MDISLRTILRAAFIYSVVALFVTLFLHPTLSVIGGLIAGSLVGIGNFGLLAYGVTSFLSPNGEEKKWGLLFSVKLIPLVLITGLLILVVRVSALAFVVGFLSIVFGIVYEGFMGRNSRRQEEGLH